MALVHRFLPRVSATFARVSSRAYTNETPVYERDIKKSVFISQSKDIFTNLALEDWLYRNFDFTNHHVLMLWQNNPCVVIGRHQNPWLETNVAELDNITEDGVQLARRSSGGGSVFHDQGTLNMTFFTASNNYNRKYNLEIITRALFRGFNIKLDISQREDLTLRNNKQVSGTAAKVGRPSAYHHCTLLVNTNKLHLSQALHKEDINIETNATKSMKSRIMNLCEENPKVTVKKLFNVVGWEYLRTAPLIVKDGGMELANKQKGFQMINPTEQWFPGIQEIRNNLESWEWRFGKTPKFTISRSFSVPDSLLTTDIVDDVKITIVVEEGKIDNISLYVPPGLMSSGVSGDVNVMTTLIGHKFSEETLDNLEWSLGTIINDKDKFVTNCVRQMMQSV